MTKGIAHVALEHSKLQETKAYKYTKGLKP